MRPGAILLVILLVAPPALAAPVRHDDYRSASDDYELLRKMAQFVLSKTVSALNASYEVDHVKARKEIGHAGSVSVNMREVVRLNPSAATSILVLAPIERASSSLTKNMTVVVLDFEAIEDVASGGAESRAKYLRAKLAHAGMADRIAAGYATADMYDALGFDTSWLRGTLGRLAALIDEVAADLEILDDFRGPEIFLEVLSPEVPLSRPLILRGLLVDNRSVAGAKVDLAVDGRPWGVASADARGIFAYDAPLPTETPVGTHRAAASAVRHGMTLRSPDVPFEVVRFPTSLVVSVGGERFRPNATLEGSIHVRDLDGNPVAGPVNVTLDGTPLAPVETGADGIATFVLPTDGLALGPHLVGAEYAGTAFYAASWSSASFRIETARVAPERAGAAWLLPLASLLALLLAQAGILEALGRLRPAALRRGAVAGPPVVAAAEFLVAGWAWGAASLVLAAGLSFAMLRRGAAVPREPARPAPAAPSTASVLAVEAKIAAVPAFEPGDSRGELLALYRALLHRLAAEGVDIEPLTHREIARLMEARGYPSAAVHEVTRRVERALYAGDAVAQADLAPFRAAVGSLGVGV